MQTRVALALVYEGSTPPYNSRHLVVQEKGDGKLGLPARCVGSGEAYSERDTKKHCRRTVKQQLLLQ